MASIYKPEWYEWIDHDVPLECTEIKLKENTPEDIKNKFYEHKTEEIKNSSEKRASL